MEVSTNPMFSHVLSNTINLQHFDSKLTAFYTILTVALSIMLSFQKSRYILINATTTYPIRNVKKCIRRLKCLKTGKRYENADDLLTKGGANGPKGMCEVVSANETAYYRYIRFLKLKRLRTFASNIKYITTNTLKLSSNNYLYKTLNATFTKIKRRAGLKRNNNGGNNGESGPSIGSMGMVSSGGIRKLKAARFSKLDAKKLSNFGAMQTYENDLSDLNRVCNANRGVAVRSRNLPRIKFSKISLYKKLPLRSMSRAWGEINSIDLPVWFRKPCFYLYSWMFGCNLEEIEIDDISKFKNLSEFFRRTLKPNVRIIDKKSCLISPCDGKILHFGKVNRGYVEQVKGVDYLLEAFLGKQNWPNPQLNQSTDVAKIENPAEYHALYEKNILKNPQENCLYHCVIYLAPGDYHRFHSPTDWEVFYRRHFPGELFSVNPCVAKWLKGLFNLNERVVYFGEWKYGFFSMTAVGATNVGSIKVYMDEDLTTNNKKSKTFDKDLEKDFSTGQNEDLKGVKISRGEDFGEFNLGSTIVLIFEAPKNFEFNISQNEKVFYGNPLGSAGMSNFL